MKPDARVILEKFAGGVHCTLGILHIAACVYNAMRGNLGRAVIHGSLAVYELAIATPDHLDELRRLP